MSKARFDKLCRSCRQIEPRYRVQSPEDRFDLYPDFPAFQASAQDGCKLCELLREALLGRYSDEGIQRGEDDYDDTIKKDWPKGPWDRRVRLTLAKIDTSEVVWTPSPWPPRSGIACVGADIRAEMYADAGDPAALHGKISLRLPNVEVLSPVNMRLIFGWMDTCEREHEKCHSEKVPRLPKRVIDVGSAEGEDNPPRLLETNRAPAQYVALSHCWGSWQDRSRYKHARLLKANYRDSLDAIRLQDVPPTLKDAIFAVRSLGLRYLWIDALCIIQDSKSDWAEQSGQMYDIYESSYLTIVATKAQSSGDGFLNRPHKSIVTIPYNDENDPTVEGQFYLSRIGEPRSSWSLVDAVSWNTRGWTFQERLLSKRLLHFSANGLYWECRTTDRSELNHSGRDSYNRTTWLLGDYFEDLLPSTESTSFDRRYERWYMVVAKYSVRELTYETDALPAVSGLAQLFQRVHTGSDEYIGGLWRHDFMRGLLWMTHNSSTARKQSVYCAPSWSWASVKGQLDWPSRTIDEHCRDDFTGQILAVHLDVLSENPMGAVLGGFVTIRGRIRRLSQVVKPVEWGALLRFRYNLICDDELVGNGSFDVDGHGEDGEVWILQIQTQKPFDCYKPYHPTALLLRKATSSNNRFERLGIAVLEDEKLDFFDRCPAREFEFV